MGRKQRMTKENLKQLVDDYERLVFTVCYQLVQDYHEAENLTQETFLSAYLHIDRCEKEYARPWLTRIAVNKAKDFLKSAYHQRVSLEESETFERLPAGEPPPEQFLIEQEGEENIRSTVLSLREPYHHVARMYFLEERSVEEISVALGRPKKTVQTQLTRAKHLLNQQRKERETDGT